MRPCIEGKNATGNDLAVARPSRVPFSTYLVEPSQTSVVLSLKALKLSHLDTPQLRWCFWRYLEETGVRPCATVNGAVAASCLGSAGMFASHGFMKNDVKPEIRKLDVALNVGLGLYALHECAKLFRK